MVRQILSLVLAGWTSFLISGNSPLKKGRRYSDLDKLRIEIIDANTNQSKVGDLPLLFLDPKQTFNYRLFETTNCGCYDSLSSEASLFVAEGRWHQLTSEQQDVVRLRDVRRVNYQIVKSVLSLNPDNNVVFMESELPSISS